MDAWMRDVHVDTLQVLDRAGVVVLQPTSEVTCCGALHHHAGLSVRAESMARDMMSAFPGDAPIVVNSAGCGAMLKEYGYLLGTPAAHTFSQRVVDIHEFLGQPSRVELLKSHVRSRSPHTVVVQDPCHLRHAQRSHLPVRDLLALVADTVDVPDDGLCCGAGGSYFLTHPHMAIELRERKISSIMSVMKGNLEFVVASANPGCSMHLGNGGVDVVHPMTLIARHLVSATDSLASSERFANDKKNA